MAPSNRTMRLGSSSSRSRSALDIRRLSRAFGAYRVVLGLRMMDGQRGRALFRRELERAREIHAELFARGKQTEDDFVIIEVGAGRITPRVALAAAWRNSQLGSLVAVQPLGHGFGCFDGDSVNEECLGVFVLRL